MKIYAIERIESNEGRETIAVFSDVDKVKRYFKLHDLNTWYSGAVIWYSTIEFELDPE